MQQYDDSRPENIGQNEPVDELLELEKNPSGWKFLEKIEDDDLIIKGQDSSGHIYEARVQASYDEEALQLYLIFKNNTTGGVAFFDAPYKCHNKTEEQDTVFCRDKAQAIMWWAIEANVPKDFAKAAWRRSRKVFNQCLHLSSVYRIVWEDEQKNKKNDQGDLFST